MVCTKLMAVYSENHKDINTLHGKNAELSLSKQTTHIVTTVFWSINTFLEEEEIQVKIPGVTVGREGKIQTWNIPNTKLEC
jgi:hypothetical protein